jgi:hypothetical protein
MNDTIHQIFQDADAYKVRITRLGEFMQEADGFSSYADAASWIAQAQRLGSVRVGQSRAAEADIFATHAGGPAARLTYWTCRPLTSWDQFFVQ